MRQLIAALALVLAADTAAAEDIQRLDAFDDWAVFVRDSPRECLATTRALSETGWPEAEAGAATGGAVSQLLITFRAADADAPGEVSFWAAGRAIASGTTLTLRSGAAEMLLFTDGAWAWPPDRDGDIAAAAGLSGPPTAELALFAGDMSAVVVRFSLRGFDNAMARARDYCSTIGAGT